MTVAKKAFNPVCSVVDPYGYGDWIDLECGEPAIAWIEVSGYIGWVCESHKFEFQNG